MHTRCINLVQARLEAVSLLVVLIINSWNSLPPSTDFSSVNAFKRPISSVDFSQLLVFISQPSIYIDGWLYAMSMTSVVCNVPVLSQNDWTYHHSVFTT